MEYIFTGEVRKTEEAIREEYHRILEESKKAVEVDFNKNRTCSPSNLPVPEKAPEVSMIWQEACSWFLQLDIQVYTAS